jgi:hypothetical protein
VDAFGERRPQLRWRRSAADQEIAGRIHQSIRRPVPRNRGWPECCRSTRTWRLIAVWVMCNALAAREQRYRCTAAWNPIRDDGGQASIRVSGQFRLN